MTFREAFLFACTANPNGIRGKAKLIEAARKADIRRPAVRRLWARAEKRVLTWYEREYGEPPETAAGAIDWQQIIQLLIDNLPAILQIILTILAMF